MDLILFLWALFAGGLGVYWIARARSLARASEMFDNSPAMFVVQGVLAIAMALFALHQVFFR